MNIVHCIRKTYVTYRTESLSGKLRISPNNFVEMGILYLPLISTLFNYKIIESFKNYA